MPTVEKLPGKAISTPRTYPPRGVVSFQLHPLKCHHILHNSPCVISPTCTYTYTHNVACEQVPHKTYPQAVLFPSCPFYGRETPGESDFHYHAHTFYKGAWFSLVMPTETSSKFKVSFACEKGPFGSRDILCHELSCLKCVQVYVCTCTSIRECQVGVRA